MKCIRKEMEAEVIRFEPGKGIEDGHRRYEEVVTGGLVAPDELFILEDSEHKQVVPFVRSRRGCTFIRVGDYVIVDADGTKHVCGEDKIWSRYEKID